MPEIPFNPWLDRVLVKREKKEKTTGGIIIPDDIRRLHSKARGVVVAVGPQCSDPCKDAVGKTVLFGAHAGAWLDHNGVMSTEAEAEWFICGEDDILGDVNET